MQTVKIAYVLTPVDFGGAERVNLNLLNNVDRNVFDIHPIVLVRPWGEENYFIRKIREAKYSVRKIPVALRPPSEGRDYLRVFRCFKMLWSILRNEPFDLVHTHGYFADIIGIPAARLLGIPVLSTCHGFISNDRNLRLYNILDRFVLRFSDRIIAVSAAIKDKLVKNRIQESRIDIIMNAVASEDDDATLMRLRNEMRDELKAGTDDFIVGYVGRLDQEKGIQTYLEAASRVIQSGPLIKFLVIGEGPQRSELEHIVNRRGIKDRVIFTGFRTDIDRCMAAMDVFVLPSLTEGTPMALLEAMAHGKPVVASAVGGVPDIVHTGENGILISPGDSEQLSEVILRLYRNRDLREKLAAAGRHTVREKYSMKKWCNRIEQIYTSLTCTK